MVDNGDFEAGAAGFGSDYAYTVPGGSNLYPEATYTVDTNPQNSHNLFSSYGDHTSGTGLFMIVNGSSEGGVQVWYSAPIAVTAGHYDFTAWLSSAYPDSPAMLDFLVTPYGSISSRSSGGPVIVEVPGSIGTFAAPGTTGVWSQAGGGFYVGAGVSYISLSIINRHTELTGNDFGIDDISLIRTVPEPATWGLMIAGFGMVGWSARRRNRSVVA